jgi:hypothetical protein
LGGIIFPAGFAHRFTIRAAQPMVENDPNR